MEQCLAEVDFECRLVHLAHYGFPNNSVLEKLPVAILRHVDCQSSVLRSEHPVEGFCPVTHPLPTWQNSSESTSCWSSGSPVCGMQWADGRNREVLKSSVARLASRFRESSSVDPPLLPGLHPLQLVHHSSTVLMLYQTSGAVRV